MGVNIGVACMCVVSATKRLGSQEFDPSGSALIDCASAITLVETSVIALLPLKELAKIGLDPKPEVFSHHCHWHGSNAMRPS